MAQPLLGMIRDEYRRRLLRLDAAMPPGRRGGRPRHILAFGDLGFYRERMLLENGASVRRAATLEDELRLPVVTLLLRYDELCPSPRHDA